MNKLLLEKLNVKQIPEENGVYFFINKKEEIIYVGKAINLRKRITQYIKRHDTRRQIFFLMEEAVSVAFIVVSNEKESLIFENRKIKELQPKYNIDLRDDKSYPYIAFTDEEFPALVITRTPWKKYLFKRGPFIDAMLLRRLLRVINVVIPIRKCSKMKKEPCLNFQLGLCPGVCVGNISVYEYMESVNKIIALLKGSGWKNLSMEIKNKMMDAAENLNFERAALLRDSLKLIPVLKEKLGIEVKSVKDEKHYLFEKNEKGFYVVSALYSESVLKKIDIYFKESISESIESDILTYFTFQSESSSLPDRIGFFPENIVDKELVCASVGRDLKILKTDAAVLEILNKNMASKIAGERIADNEINKLLKAFSILAEKEVHSIACVDISNFYDDFNVASLVFWENGKFLKKHYRLFKVKTVIGPDDFSSMHEVVERAVNKWFSDEWKKPDILFIDGGKGQLSAISDINELPFVIGIVKDRKKERGFEKMIFMDGKEVFLDNSTASLLIKKIRDEAHRFGISYNRNLQRDKIQSQISEIKGVGPEKEKSLINTFGTIEDLKKASIEEIRKAPLISENLANQIYNFFHKQ